MALPNARNQYLKTQVETASKEQLVVMLFDGIIRFTEQARKAIEEKQIEDSHHALMRAQAIIMELICTVDREKGGDIANNLLSLHAYAFNCLISCNMHKETKYIDDVQKIYRELREAWVGAMDSLGISSNAGKPLTAVAPVAAAAANGAPVTGRTLGVSSGVGRSALPHHAATAAGTSLTAAPAAAAPAPAAAASAAPAPVGGIRPVTLGAPVAGKAAGYGLGRTAGIGGAATPTAPAAPAPAAGITPANPLAGLKSNAMINAYTNSTRSIA